MDTFQEEEEENNWSDDDASEGSRDGTESHRSAVQGSVGRGGRGDNGGKSSGNKVNSVRCDHRTGARCVWRVFLFLFLGGRKRAVFVLCMRTAFLCVVVCWCCVLVLCVVVVVVFVAFSVCFCRVRVFCLSGRRGYTGGWALRLMDRCSRSILAVDIYAL